MKSILFSFDLEEFDMPLEYGSHISFGRQIEISARGTETILDIVRGEGIQATFFSTVVFAKEVPHLIHRIKNEGHELASHGYYHSVFEESHVLESKIALESIYRGTVHGFRMPRMKPISFDALADSGYTYNSSLNPTFLPGRYNNFFQPRRPFLKNGVWQLPASVTPIIRLPLFWLSFHNLPMWLYKMACLMTIKTDGYLNLYFHPWEFENLKDTTLGLPSYVTRNTGDRMIERFIELIKWMKKDYDFLPLTEFVATRSLSN